MSIEDAARSRSRPLAVIIREHGSALWKRTCPVRINEDVSPGEMGIYCSVFSLVLLRFMLEHRAVLADDHNTSTNLTDN
ncbi:hypothetical protein GWI33_020303 [Rhynchophorus ferrugineus]|uniref:Uncharacterized protein n=1 Tax=Rhynchophorus ferrugineus TaxID=354439 RepID=A0A834HSI5_RHYFE|nr:hypothetical protein GWI33_020303 [Rhynchophorus ferrugineus]